MTDAEIFQCIQSALLAGRTQDKFVSTSGVWFTNPDYDARAARPWQCSPGFIGMSVAPSGFLPQEDQGYLFVAMQLPDAASLQRTDAAAQRVTKALLQDSRESEALSGSTASVLLTQTQSTNTAFFFVSLKPGACASPAEQIEAIQASVQQKLAGVSDGIAFSFPPPAIPGIGTSGGVTMILQDRSGNDDPNFLTKNVFAFLGAVSKRPEIAAAVPSYLPAVRNCMQTWIRKRPPSNR